LEKFNLLTMIKWWDKVTEHPLLINNKEFNSGRLKKFIRKIPSYGQIDPSSIFGENIKWKKDQKNLIKNRTSETINKIILQIVIDKI